MPRGLIHSVELGLNYLCDVVKNALLLESKRNAVDSMLLHCGAHVCELDHGVLSILLVNLTVSLHILRILLGVPDFL